MSDFHIPEPFQFNPLKHHLKYIRDFMERVQHEDENLSLVKEIKKIGSSVMDVYTGEISVHDIIGEMQEMIRRDGLDNNKAFGTWAGTGFSDFRHTSLSDGSCWTLKYHESPLRYVHLFPARSSPHTFRVKANTLKSAILYLVLSGKDFVSVDELNNARAAASLSPVKDIAETEAIFEMIEILRYS